MREGELARERGAGKGSDARVTPDALAASRNLPATVSRRPRYWTPKHNTTSLRASPNSSRSNRVFDMWRPSLFLAAVLAVPSQALHFFIDGANQKCFFEELPKDTMVVGMPDLAPSAPPTEGFLAS